MTRVTAGVVALIVAFAATAAATPKTQTFESPVYGYSIDVPATWSVRPGNHELALGGQPLTCCGGVDILARHAESTRVSQMRFPVLVIGAQPIGAGTNLDTWTEIVMGIVRDQKGCAAPARSERVEVGGWDADWLTYPGCPAGTGYVHLWVTVIDRVHGRGYQIVFFDNAGHEAKNRRQLRRILASLSFDLPGSG